MRCAAWAYHGLLLTEGNAAPITENGLTIQVRSLAEWLLQPSPVLLDDVVNPVWVASNLIEGDSIGIISGTESSTERSEAMNTLPCPGDQAARHCRGG